MIKRNYFMSGRKYFLDSPSKFSLHYVQASYRSFLPNPDQVFEEMKEYLDERIEENRTEGSYSKLHIDCFCRC